MKTGAFALIDCLGFKGVWRRMPNGNPKPLLKKLSKIQASIEKRLEKGEAHFEWLHKIHVKSVVRLLSDTVAISIHPVRGHTTSAGTQVEAMCMCVNEVLRLFMTGEPNLSMRGCITYGEHVTAGNFIAGPAVDEAAEHMNIADGAFVWLLPPAQRAMKRRIESIHTLRAKQLVTQASGRLRFYARTLEELEEVKEIWTPGGLVVSDYPMPIKGGGVLNVDIINPFPYSRGIVNARKMLKCYSKAMAGDKLDIMLKRQNTDRFLTEASERYAKLIKLRQRAQRRGLRVRRYPK